MSDKYGYIGIETLLNFCSNDKNHCVTPNDFMRMNRIKIDDRPRGTWTEEFDENANPFFQRRWRCSACNDYNYYGKPDFCLCCGADMRKEGDEK